MLEHWHDLGRINMTGVLGGRVLKLDPWSEPGRLQASTGGTSLDALRVGDTVDVVMLGDSCAKRYSSVYVSAIVARIDCNDESKGTTAVVVDPNGRRTLIPLRAERLLSLEPVGWTFDEMVGTTVRDRNVRGEHFNIQLRRRYDARGFVGREYVVFSCKRDVQRHEIFTHACRF